MYVIPFFSFLFPPQTSNMVSNKNKICHVSRKYDSNCTALTVVVFNIWKLFFLQQQWNDSSLCWDKTPALCSWLISALRAQVYYMSDCKRKCSLLIYERCSVILRVEALVANLCSLFPFHRDANDALGQANTTMCAFSGSTRFVPVWRCHPGSHTKLRPVCFTREVNLYLKMERELFEMIQVPFVNPVGQLSSGLYPSVLQLKPFK